MYNTFISYKIALNSAIRERAMPVITSIINSAEIKCASNVPHETLK